MELEKKEKEIIEQAIAEWERTELVSSDKAKQLRESLSIKKGRAQVAQYFFIIAIASMLLAFAAIFIDDKLLERIRQYFDIGNIVIAVACSIISISWFIYLAKARKRFTSLLYEVYLLMGGMVMLCALVYYCKDIGFGPNYSGFLGVTALLTFGLAAVFRSKTLWTAGVLAGMGWYGSFAESWQNEHNLFFGMNYPMRFTVFGVVVICFSFLQHNIGRLQFSKRISYLAGLVIFFTGMWGVSIFGNYGHYEAWLQVRQVQVIGYSIVLAIISAAALLLGIKYKDDATRDFGIIFILLNLYSRYFEFFWNTTNKGIFFLILAVSFAVVGWQIEKRVKRNAKQAS